MNKLYLGDNLQIMREMPAESIDLSLHRSTFQQRTSMNNSMVSLDVKSTKQWPTQTFGNGTMQYEKLHAMRYTQTCRRQ